MNYDLADKAIKDMNRRNLRSFDGLKTLKFDEPLDVLEQFLDSFHFSVLRPRWLNAFGGEIHHGGLGFGHAGRV